VFARVATDVRFAARIALRRKWVSLAVVLSIAFGISGTTAIAAVIDRILLRTLPIPHAERVVWLRTHDAQLGRTAFGANPGDAFDWRERAKVFSAVGWYNEAETTARTSDTDDPARLRMALVSPDFARALGVRPLLGRLFTEDDYAGGSNSVVVTHRFWRGRLAADPGAVGRTIFLNNVPRTIVAVLPPAGDLLPEPDFDIWRPLLDNVQQRTQARTATYLVVIARLADGVTLARAQSAMAVIARQLAAEYPLTNAARSVKVEPLSDGVVGPARPMFLLLGGAVATILLIACASVANVLVAQSEDRGREIAIRTALGGTAGRLIRQLVTETMLLCTIGGTLGVALAPAALRGFVALYPGTLPRASELGIDWRVLTVSALAIVMAGLLASGPLVRQALRSQVSRGLGAGGRVAGSRSQRRFANGLVVAQLALSIVLLFGGSLLLSTYRSVARVDVGFDASHLLTFDVTPSRARYPSDQHIDAFYQTLEERLRDLGGVRAVGVSNLIPFAAGNLTELYSRDGRNDVMPNLPQATMQVVSDDFVSAMGLPLVRGRDIESMDRMDSPPVVVVNAALAAAHFPGEDAIGKHVTLRGRSWEIVGIVGDKRHSTLRQAPVPEMFVSRRQLPRELGGWVTVRTVGDPASIAAAVRRAVRATDPTIAVAHVATMAERRSASAAGERFRAVVVTVFAVLAVALATLGLYGVVADGVSRRTREIGIRMALGESTERVQRGVLWTAATLCLTGVVIGAGAALPVAVALRRFLLPTTPNDGLVLGAISALLCAVTLVAAYLPARRASRVDPAVALRDSP
jgi:putative ABC transport system permease protein